MNRRLPVVALVVLALALFGSIYVVGQGQSAIVLNLGKVVRSDIGPGLHFKFPLVESVRVFDRRLQVIPADPERYLTLERKDVSVDFFAVGMIEDVRAFAVADPFASQTPLYQRESHSSAVSTVTSGQLPM